MVLFDRIGPSTDTGLAAAYLNGSADSFNSFYRGRTLLGSTDSPVSVTGFAGLPHHLRIHCA